MFGCVGEKINLVFVEIIAMDCQGVFDAGQFAERIERAGPARNGIGLPDSQLFEERNKLSCPVGQQFQFGLASRPGASPPEGSLARRPDRRCSASKIGMDAVRGVRAETTDGIRRRPSDVRGPFPIGSAMRSGARPRSSRNATTRGSRRRRLPMGSHLAPAMSPITVVPSESDSFRPAMARRKIGSSSGGGRRSQFQRSGSDDAT